ncbi:MAG: thiol:disulfide interchange protein DsbG [Gammaproteobacteria bacterium]
MRILKFSRFTAGLALPLLAATACGASTPAKTPVRVKAPAPATQPEALAYLIGKGFTVQERFSTPGDLTGYLGTTPGGKQIMFYVPADGSVAIFGVMLDAHGHNLTQSFMRHYLQGPAAKKTYKELGERRWIAEGDLHPRRIVYAFIDPDCPYCWQFWKTARKFYDQGVQVRYLMVGILGDSSVGKAAAILAAKNPQQALDENERGFAHHSGAIKPLATIPDALHKELADNVALMQRFGFDGTPGLVWQTDAGEIETSNGLPPDEELANVFGTAKEKPQ